MADQTEQTTLVHNEEEAFALEPIDITGELCYALFIVCIVLIYVENSNPEELWG